MSTTIQRTGDAGNNFQQMTTGETPNSVEVTLNAKGAAQLGVKLYYATADEMSACVAIDLDNIIAKIKLALADQGISLAGQEGK